MISIGTVLRGPELDNSEIRTAIMALSKAINEIRGPLELGKIPLVNSIFFVAGSLGEAGFNDLVYGKFSKKDKVIVVQIAVPPNVVLDNNRIHFLENSLIEANHMAYNFMKKNGIEFPLTEANGMVERAASAARGV
jgi:hypothetical protein